MPLHRPAAELGLDDPWDHLRLLYAQQAPDFLLELLELIGRARLVVSGDTGVAHVAAAYRTPSVTLFGPVSPALWGPPADPRHQVLWHGDDLVPGGRYRGDPHVAAAAATRPAA